MPFKLNRHSKSLENAANEMETGNKIPKIDCNNGKIGIKRKKKINILSTRPFWMRMTYFWCTYPLPKQNHCEIEFYPQNHRLSSTAVHSSSQIHEIINKISFLNRLYFMDSWVLSTYDLVIDSVFRNTKPIIYRWNDFVYKSHSKYLRLAKIVKWNEWIHAY